MATSWMNLKRPRPTEYDDRREYISTVLQYCRQLDSKRNNLQRRLDEVMTPMMECISKTKEPDAQRRKDVATSDNTTDVQKFIADFPLRSLFWRYQRLQTLCHYLLVLQTAGLINLQLTDNVSREDWRHCCDLYTKLSNFVRRFDSTACTRLKEWLLSLMRYWTQKLSKVASDRIEKDIVRLALSLSDTPFLEASVKGLSESQSLCRLILLVADDKTLAEVVARPFGKRFRVYFCGADTASSVTSEWYFNVSLKWRSAGLQWFRDHLDVDDRRAANVFTEFNRLMIEMVQQKLSSDLTEALQGSDVLKFSQLIDNAIWYDTQLEGSEFPDTGCMEVLEDPKFFKVWIKLEEEQSSVCIENLLAESSGWELRFPQEGSHDDLKVPICTDNFLLMLVSMTRRFKFLPSHGCRLHFVRLQRLLVDNFRLHLQQLSSCLQSVWLTPFPEVINSAEYVAFVLSQWQEQTLYVELEEGIFDEMIVLFKDFKLRMISDSVEVVLEDCKGKLKGLISAVNDNQPSLENVFYLTLVVPVQKALVQMQQALSGSCFTTWASELAKGLDSYLIPSFIFQIRVSRKIGTEVQELFVDSVFRLFRFYGINVFVSFQRLAQCLHLLSLNAGTCSLFRRQLTEQPENSDGLFRDIGVEKLTLVEVRAILDRRSDLL